MARINFVKKAQQRYRMIPVIDPATGEQKQTETSHKNKHGQSVMLGITEPDKSQPTPNDKCESCDTEIIPGMPYRWVQPKNGGRRTRCADCPSWQPWDLSSALWARIAQIQDGFDISDVQTPDEVSEALSEMADEIRSLADEKHEAASNLEEGFGHSTSQSEEIEQQADELESWADDIENVDVPDLPEPEETDCEACNGAGEIGDDDGRLFACEDCDGSGQVPPGDDPSDEQMEEWRSDVEAACTITEESPV